MGAELPTDSKCLLAIVAIAALAIASVSKGVDGQIMWLAIICIAGLGGYDVYTQLKREDAARSAPKI